MRNPVGLKLLGGGQEFQEQTPYSELPADLFAGPPPRTQSAAGNGGSPIYGLALAPSSAPPQDKYAGLPPDLRALITAVQRIGDVTMYSGTVGTQAILVRPAERRTYLLLQNTSAANSLLFGIGVQPAVITGGFTGFLLAANGGSFEPQVIPQQDIWLLGSAAGTLFTIAFSTD